MGTGDKCMLTPDVNDCGPDQTCQCAKYRFQCSEDDQGCTESEQSAKTIKWSYVITTKDTCESMEKNSDLYMDLTCCSKNKCNKPEDNDCSDYPTRRRNLRKLANLFDME